MCARLKKEIEMEICVPSFVSPFEQTWSINVWVCIIFIIGNLLQRFVEGKVD